MGEVVDALSFAQVGDLLRCGATKARAQAAEAEAGLLIAAGGGEAGGGEAGRREVLLSAPGGGPQNVVVCRACEKSDPDLAALRKGLALPFFHGVSRGAHVSERCEHPGHGQPAASC